MAAPPGLEDPPAGGGTQRPQPARAPRVADVQKSVSRERGFFIRRHPAVFRAGSSASRTLPYGGGYWVGDVGENVEVVCRACVDGVERGESSGADATRGSRNSGNSDGDYSELRGFPEARPCHGREEIADFLVGIV